MAQDIRLVGLDGKQLVVFLTMAGTAHCFDVRVLQDQGNGWTSLWKLPQSVKGTCTENCPAVRADVDGGMLVVDVPSASQDEDATESCKSVKWTKYNFRWDGNTFQPLN